MPEMERVGLLFGSFNPIHNGHLMIANYMLIEIPFDEIWFVVSPQNPFKKRESLASEHNRIEMVNLAIADFNYFKAIDVEFKMQIPSYTIETLKLLREMHLQIEFSLIMGSDNLQNFHKWKNYHEILENYKIVVYPRKGFNINIEHSNINVIKAPIIELSSTYIREKIKQRKKINFFLPEKVYQYIENNTLYK